jgi:hypothetical protein
LARSDDHSNAGGETETGHRISTQIPPAVSLAKTVISFGVNSSRKVGWV